MDALVFFFSTLAVIAHQPWLVALPVLFYAFIRQWSVLFWLGLGILTALGHCVWYQTSLADRDPYQVVSIEGRVQEHLQSGGQHNIVFILDRVNNEKTYARGWLSCYRGCKGYRVGYRYRLKAVLRKPHTLRNLGSLHHGNLLQRLHINFVVKPRSNPVLLKTPATHQTSWRLLMQNRIARHLTALPLDEASKAIIEALVIGDSHAISKSLWDVFRLTGTTHLMVISGAHIGLLASMLYVVFFWLWRRSVRLCLLLSAPQAASIASMLGAILYAWLSGFAPPAERALLAVLFVLSRFWVGRQFSMLLAWRYAIMAVLFIEPHAVMMPGFYLSFLAALILILSRLMVKRGYLANLFLVQSMCLIGLTPLTLYFFGFGGLNGLVTNLFAIPWVGYAILPLGILTVCLPESLASYTAVVLQKLVSALLLVLDYFARYPIALPLGEVPLNWVLTAYLMLVLLVFWRWFIARGLILVLAVILCFPFDTSLLPKDTVRIDVLDVGQGLAVAVHTKSHHMLFDTGGAWFGGDMGKLVVLPYLQAEGVRALDKVVISHGDLDHRGGYESIKQRIPIGEVISNGLGKYASFAHCRDTPAWEWEGVHFRFLNPKTAFSDSNNRSCVLKITANGRSMLLTGDIEKKAEDALVGRYRKHLRADVLLLAHHASKTSSSEGFLRAVAPQYVIASYAYANPYRFPHAAVLDRLKDHKLALLNTADMGMIRVQSSQRKWTIQTYG